MTWRERIARALRRAADKVDGLETWVFEPGTFDLEQPEPDWDEIHGENPL